MLKLRGVNVVPSATMAFSRRAKELVHQGVDVVSFGMGEPDFATPDAIGKAGIKAIEAGRTKYSPAQGLLELREAIARKLERENGLRYDPGEILVSSGAKQSLYNVILAYCAPHDEVLIPTPCWVSYPAQVEMTGAKPVLVRPADRSRLTVTPEEIEKHITPRTTMLILNNPSNPTGAVFREEDVRGMCELAIQHGFLILSDEIYERIVYDGMRVVSPASFSDLSKEHVVVVNGVSKTYAMTGWRIGYAAGPKNIIQAASNIQSQTTSGANTIAQWAAVEALNGDQSVVDRMVTEFDKRRKLIVELLNDIDGISCQMPQGAFYVFPDVSGLFGRTIGGREIACPTDFAEVLLEVAHVAVVPGEPFGSDRHVRLSYAASTEQIRKGVERIKALVNG